MFRTRSVEDEPALIAPETMVFVLLGALMTVCGGFRVAYERVQPQPSQSAFYLYGAMIAIGVIFIAIGLNIARMALMTRAEARKDIGRNP